MTEEQNNEVRECKCFCKSELFKKFILVTVGTFIGVYCALCLFTAVHRPHFVPPMRPPMEYGQHFRGHHGYGNFHKRIPPVDMQRPDRFNHDVQRPQKDMK